MPFIYDELAMNHQTKQYLGLFDAKLSRFSEIAPSENFVYSNGISDDVKNKEITKDTLIVYYCGAFTYFHSGHYALMEKAYNDLSKKHKDVRIVISPANSDYIAQKYGDSVGVSNKQRYDRIVDYLNRSEYSDFTKSIMIDLNPMLNMVCDFNFTDLLKNFVEKYHPYDDMVTPYILCGKDREYFKALEKNTDKLKVYYDEGDDTSSSDMLSFMGSFKKKHIILRVHTKQEYDIFVSHMSSLYSSITPSYISDEISHVKTLIGYKKPLHNYIFTNCKDYSDILPYVKISRSFLNPLSNPKIHGSPFKKGDLVIDSDVFSGLTKNRIEASGATLEAIFDFSDVNDTHDIVDIDDLLKNDFKYPYYDLSSRMGLPLFYAETHDIINKLKYELAQTKMVSITL